MIIKKKMYLYGKFIFPRFVCRNRNTQPPPLPFLSSAISSSLEPTWNNSIFCNYFRDIILCICHRITFFPVLVIMILWTTPSPAPPHEFKTSHSVHITKWIWKENYYLREIEKKMENIALSFRSSTFISCWLYGVCLCVWYAKCINTKDNILIKNCIWVNGDFSQI